MNAFQKVIKIFAICLAIFIIVNIISGILFGLSIITNIGFVDTNVNSIEVENFSETYENIDKINIEVTTSNIVIKQGNEFKVEANNLSNKFSSKLENGNLKIKEGKMWLGNNDYSGLITIYIPSDIILDKLKIDSGAGKIEISDISVDEFDIDHGAGFLEISNSEFNKTDIDGGAGEIRIIDSVLNDLKMDAGVGKITVESEITGNSKIECGIGEMNISLLGDEDDYSITAEKGIGNIKINNKNHDTDTVYGSGKNKLRIEGGVGSISVDFE